MKQTSRGTALLIVVIFVLAGLVGFVAYQISPAFRLIDQKQPSCKDIDTKSPRNVGITFLQDYCIGNICGHSTTKLACETLDVVKVENGKLSTGKDNVPDCIWKENAANSGCTPKY